MIGRIVTALVVGVVVWLACLLLGMLLTSVGGPGFLLAIGGFFSRFAALIGLLAALWHFFRGSWSITRA